MTITRVPNSILESPVNANILINPSFTVQQRGAVINHTSSTLKFGPDRWKFRGVPNVGGSLVRTSTVLDATTGVNKLKVETSGATSYGYTYQFVEAVNLQGLYGGEITFSFGYSDSGSGDPKVNLISYDSGGTPKTLFDAVPTDLGGGRWSCTVTLSTDDGTFPDLTASGMRVQIYPNEGNTAPDEWYVWETKLEAGSEVTLFIARPYGEELALCQRYAQVTKLIATDNPSTQWASWLLPVVMRAAPTITNQSADNPSVTPSYNSNEGMMWQSNSVSTTATVTFTLDAEL